MYRHLLVPIDGSPTAKAGLRHALSVAKQTGARVTLLHVVDERASIRMAAFPAAASFVTELRAALREQGEALLARAVADASKSGLRIESLLVESLGGPIGEVIARQAQRLRADAIVIGTHGRRGLSRLVMGSDAESVVRLSRVPVILVRDTRTGREMERRR